MASSSLTQYKGGHIVNPRNLTALLDIDRIKQNPLYKCTISGGRVNKAGGLLASTITGIYNPDSMFEVSVGSEYVDTFTMPFDTSKLNEVGGFAENMSGKTQFILKSLRMTEQRWNGSTSPEFTIKLDIPIVRRTDASWKIMKYVLQATSGTLNDYAGAGQTQSADSALQIFAPNGYRVNYGTSAGSQDFPQGTYTIALGEGATRWFLMPQALITNASCAISGKKYYDGNPTSITVTISFKFWRQPMYEDIVDWFPLAKRYDQWL